MSDTSSDNNTQFEKNLLYKASWYYYMEGLTQQAIAEKLEKLQAQNVPAEAPKPEADGENQETHKVSLEK